jgi:hypothetical protein
MILFFDDDDDDDDDNGQCHCRGIFLNFSTQASATLCTIG